MLSTKENEKNGLLILHLSDVHFKEPVCLNLLTDPDHSVRDLLIRDIKKMVVSLGAVDAIIITGDIAYKAHKEEYDVALNWFHLVAEASQCSINSIYTVPGNHDINRITGSTLMVRSVRALFDSSKSVLEKDNALREILANQETGAQLLLPSGEYNKFAARFSCDVDAKNPFWIETLELAPGWKLAIHGLTSTLFSGPGDDKKGGLHTGDIQRSFSKEDGTIRLAAMHHPPEWMGDQDEFEDALNEHCSIQLFGHKHRQRYIGADTCVKLAAGAVNPARNEPNWEPGYNFIQLSIDHAENVLCVESHLRKWQTSPDKFVAKLTLGDLEAFPHRIKLYVDPLPVKIEADTRKPETRGVEVLEEESLNLEEAKEVPMNNTLRREIIFKFWELSASERRYVMQDLNLLNEGDDNISEPLRYRLAFERARERDAMREIEAKIESIRSKRNGDQNA